MPDDWSVLLTTSPLFTQKVALIDSMTIHNHGNTNDTTKSRLVFLIGTDTLVRLLNPKYYGNNHTSMLTAIREMKQKGVHFIVGGRLEQQVQQSRVFVSGEEQIQTMPEDIQSMFTLLSEEEFRMDISSTEIRNKQKRL
jgi:nicotinic acid mononucleotide adenylyltransferase